LALFVSYAGIVNNVVIASLAARVIYPRLPARRLSRLSIQRWREPARYRPAREMPARPGCGPARVRARRCRSRLSRRGEDLVRQAEPAVQGAPAAPARWGRRSVQSRQERTGGRRPPKHPRPTVTDHEPVIARDRGSPGDHPEHPLFRPAGPAPVDGERGRLGQPRPDVLGLGARPAHRPGPGRHRADGPQPGQPPGPGGQPAGTGPVAPAPGARSSTTSATTSASAPN